MKRGRKSKKIKQEEPFVQVAGTSIRDVSNQILINILSRLSVKLVFRCRSVCKLWLKLLLDSNFAKLHFSRAPTCPLLRDDSEMRISKALYLVELERDSLCDVSDYSCDVRECKPLCDRHVNMKLRTVFMIPERQCDSKFKLRKRRFQVVNSCNGLLCLRSSVNGYPIVIFNPVTGEYSVLPEFDEPNKDRWEGMPIVGGLGFCPKTNQYKVLVMIFEVVLNPATTKWDLYRTALVYTLGSGPWRRVGKAPYFKCGVACPAFLNGALHWYVDNFRYKEFILSFDFEGEQFHALPSPTTKFKGTEIDDLLEYSIGFDMEVSQSSIWGMGVLRGCLYLCRATDYSPMDLFLMNQYGVQDSWHRVYTDPISKERWPVGYYQPIDFLNNGDLLMYQEENVIMSTDGHKFKYFKIREPKGRITTSFQAIAHVPSFVSLKEVMGNHMEVLNVKSRLANNGAVKRLCLVEEDHQPSIPQYLYNYQCRLAALYHDYETETAPEKLEASQTSIPSTSLPPG